MRLHRVNRRALMIAARRLTQPISAILLKTRRRHLKLPILDSAAEIRWRSLHSKKAKSFSILVPALASIVFLLLVLSEKAER